MITKAQLKELIQKLDAEGVPDSAIGKMLHNPNISIPEDKLLDFAYKIEYLPKKIEWSVGEGGAWVETVIQDAMFVIEQG